MHFDQIPAQLFPKNALVLEYNPARVASQTGGNRLLTRLRSPEELSVEELRRLLIEKRRAERQARLERFRRSGRVIPLASQEKNQPQPTATTGDELLFGDEELQQSRRTRPNRRATMDRVLFYVEIVAVVGLIFVLLSGFSVWRDLNREVALALEQPTLTPTPLIMAVVLPSGHTPPNSPGGVQFNEAEIPEHLRPLVQTLANLPLPTPGPEQAVRIQIPAINVDAPVVQGDGWEQLKKGVGQHIGTPNPGQTGNIVLSAHNDVFGEIFRDLDRLKKGDQVVLFTSQRTFTYVVQQVQVVEPTRVEVMAPSQEPIVTLISCYPYMKNDKRIVVSAVLQQ